MRGLEVEESRVINGMYPPPPPPSREGEERFMGFAIRRPRDAHVNPSSDPKSARTAVHAAVSSDNLSAAVSYNHVPPLRSLDRTHPRW